MSDLIPDIIPDEKKPLDPPFDYDEDFEGDENYSQPLIFDVCLCFSYERLAL